MSTKLQDAQSRYSIENKGPRKRFSFAKTRYSIENKAGYQKLYELKNA